MTDTYRHSPSRGGVPQSSLYDNTKLVVARMLGEGKLWRPQVSKFDPNDPPLLTALRLHRVGPRD